MSIDLFADLRVRFPGTTVRRTPSGPILELVTDDVRVDLVARALPPMWGSPTGNLVLAAATIPLAGFTMRLRPLNRTRGMFAADDDFVRALGVMSATLAFNEYQIVQNDPALAAAWVDVAVKAVAARTLGLGLVQIGDDLMRVDVIGSMIDVVDGEVRVFPTQQTPDHLAACARAAALIATRPQRLADELRDVMRAVGAVATGTWGLGDEHASFVTSRATPIAIDHVRILPDDDGFARLRTRLHARRVGGSDSYALFRRGVSEASHRGSDLAVLEARLARLAALIATADVSAMWSKGDHVTVTLEGLVRSPTRLAAAIDLVSRLAVEHGDAHGPYR